MKTRASDSTSVDLKPLDTGSSVAIRQFGPETSAIAHPRRSTEDLGAATLCSPALFASLCSREHLVACVYPGA